MPRRVGAFLVVATCVASACGSRRSGAPLDAAEGAAVAVPTTGPRSADPAKVGTLEAACGRSAPASGATDTGVTDTTIKIGVISDKSGVIAVPTAGVDGSVEAFVQFCNSLGGIHGRKLVLKHYDSKILNEGDAMKQACEDGLFALVGSGSVQDDQGAVTMVQCGLVEVAGYTATYVKGLSPRVFSPVPNPGTQYAVGPGKLIARQFPDAVKKAGILWPNLPVGRTQAARQRDAFEQSAGFTFVYSNPTDVLVQNWGPIVSVLQSRGVEWMTDVTTLSEMEHLLQAMSDAMASDRHRSRSAVLRRESPGKAGCRRGAGTDEYDAVRGGRPQPRAAGVPAVVEEGFSEHAADDPRRAGVLRGLALRPGRGRVGLERDACRSDRRLEGHQELGRRWSAGARQSRRQPGSAVLPLHAGAREASSRGTGRSCRRTVRRDSTAVPPIRCP